MTVPEDSLVGTTVLTPVSNDRDASSNRELSFAITKGNDQVTLSMQYFLILLKNVSAGLTASRGHRHRHYLINTIINQTNL